MNLEFIQNEKTETRVDYDGDADSKDVNVDEWARCVVGERKIDLIDL
jgi:hypothetical protein